ncbi:glycosyltransferase family 4 protein [Ferruginibacter lapsinanis]|uniref:glycosyltransferase family 4 protein n=1 Tax=Ferruginibacter lapsinanis TaxID=563172 RepID=UPI001E342487|nr:glycosyltransferase family 4 protein [Ferruginibacter lapsinanis]UEG49450.1 glycosyltransferase family 4 protein [Ferruginibacter lapsinanis]
MKKLVIITTHPIQYNAPLFKLISSRKNIDLKIFYTWGQAKDKVYDPGFGREREWDIPLLDGYDYEFIDNVSKAPGSNHFQGIVNPSLIKKIEDFNPSAILVFGWSFNSHLKVLRHFKNKIPVWLRGDSNLLDMSSGVSIKKNLRKLFLKWVFKHIDKAFYVGTANKKYFLEYGVPENNTVFAPHAIDNNRFADNNGEYDNKAKEWRKELGIMEENVVFLFAGKLESKKNPALLAMAFEKLAEDNAHLIIVGNGVLEQELKEKFKSVKNLHFIDFQNQSLMPVVYRLGDIFVLPSKGPGETWGLAINESMACGRSVLVSDKCGCAVDLVQNGKNGYVFRSDDMTDLCEKMKIMISQKKNFKDMSAVSLSIIKNWSFENVAKAIEKSLCN